MNSLRGQLLIAAATLRDPNFMQTVVLIVQHDENGALGLVLNRPLELTVAQACGQSTDAAAGVDDPMYQGGPCQGPLMLLHRDAAVGDEPIVAGVYFTAQREEIEEVMRKTPADTEPDTTARKFFANYSGWSPHQLDAELEQGAWLIVPATLDDVFCARDDQWVRLVRRLTLSRYIDPDRIPPDPSLN